MNLVFLNSFHLMKKSVNSIIYKDLEKYENEWINSYYAFFKNNHDFTNNKSLKVLYLSTMKEYEYDRQNFIFRNLDESIQSDKSLKKILKEFFPDLNEDKTKREAIIMLSGKNILLLDMFYASPMIEVYENENNDKIISQNFKDYHNGYNYTKFNNIIKQLIEEMGNDADIEMRFLFNKSDY
ncbi:MAG: hypothetical protein ACOYOV_10950 [Bacteroidales bacterium]